MRCLRFLLVVLAAAAWCMSFGGTYVIDTNNPPHGGGMSSDFGYGYVQTTTYTSTTASLGGAGGGGHTTLFGTMTFTFKWTGPEAPPKSVVVKKHGFVERGSDWTPGNTVSDGLGHAQTAVSNDYHNAHSISTGDKYEVVQGAQSITVTITPQGAVDNGYMTANFQASLTPVTVSVAGTIQQNGNLKALIGQRQVASINAGYPIQTVLGTGLPNVQWNLPLLDVFGSETWGASTYTNQQELVRGGHHYIDIPSSNIVGVTSVGYYVAKPKSQTVSATATVVFPDNTTASVQGETSVDVVAPPHAFVLSSNGTSQYDTWPYPGFMNSGNTNGLLNETGARFIYTVQTIEPFLTQEGNSTTYLSQLILPNQTWYTSLPSTQTSSKPNYVLDNVLYYDSPAAPYSASSTEHNTGYQTDTPGMGISYGTPRVVKVTANHNFLMSAVYVPVASGAGDSASVPLSTAMWDWHCTGQEGASIGNWTQPVGNPSSIWQQDFRRDCYEWDDVATNV